MSSYSTSAAAPLSPRELVQIASLQLSDKLHATTNQDGDDDGSEDIMGCSSSGGLRMPKEATVKDVGYNCCVWSSGKEEKENTNKNTLSAMLCSGCHHFCC